MASGMNLANLGLPPTESLLLAARLLDCCAQEAIGIQFPTHVEGVEQMPLDGVSMVYTWNNATAKERKAAQYFEVMGSRGIYKDGWFASVFGPRALVYPSSLQFLFGMFASQGFCRIAVWSCVYWCILHNYAPWLKHVGFEGLVQVKSATSVAQSSFQVFPGLIRMRPAWSSGILTLMLLAFVQSLFVCWVATKSKQIVGWSIFEASKAMFLTFFKILPWWFSSSEWATPLPDHLWIPKKSKRAEVWELYDLTKDYSQAKDSSLRFCSGSKASN